MGMDLESRTLEGCWRATFSRRRTSTSSDGSLQDLGFADESLSFGKCAWTASASVLRSTLLSISLRPTIMANLASSSKIPIRKCHVGRILCDDMRVSSVLS